MSRFTKISIISMLICCITLFSYAVDLTELQGQKDEIQTKLDENNDVLEKVKEELSQNLYQIYVLDQNIIQTESKLTELDKEAEALESQIIKITEKLKKATKDYNEIKELLDKRLVAMYEEPQLNYLKVVLGSSSISDFISTYYLLSEIASYDNEILEDAGKKKNEIENEEKKLSQDKSILEEQQKNVKKTRVALSNTKTLRENYITKLNQEEQKVQQEIDEYNAQINSIETEIRSLSATINFGEEYNGGEMKWPIYGHYNVTSNYGMRVHPITGVYKLHTGVDISASIGTEFTAIANGIVVKAGYNTAYGNMVVIDHGGGVQTLYAHGSEIVSTLGQEVKAGDVVLKVGSTGYSTGPHAHFEVRKDGNPLNPLDYVSKPVE